MKIDMETGRGNSLCMKEICSNYLCCAVHVFLQVAKSSFPLLLALLLPLSRFVVNVERGSDGLVAHTSAAFQLEI